MYAKKSVDDSKNKFILIINSLINQTVGWRYIPIAESILAKKKRFELKTLVASGGLAFLLCALGWSLLSGCESDPLLAPQSEEEEEGSYGLSTFPGDEVAAIDRQSNPELF